MSKKTYTNCWGRKLSLMVNCCQGVVKKIVLLDQSYCTGRGETMSVIHDFLSLALSLTHITGITHNDALIHNVTLINRLMII